jgi:hypothetical protein
VPVKLEHGPPSLGAKIEIFMRKSSHPQLQRYASLIQFVVTPAIE